MNEFSIFDWRIPILTANDYLITDYADLTDFLNNGPNMPEIGKKRVVFAKNGGTKGKRQEAGGGVEICLLDLVIMGIILVNSRFFWWFI